MSFWSSKASTNVWSVLASPAWLAAKILSLEGISQARRAHEFPLPIAQSGGVFSCLGCRLFSVHQFLFSVLLLHPLLRSGVLVSSSVVGDQTAARLGGADCPTDWVSSLLHQRRSYSSRYPSINFFPRSQGKSVLG